MRNELNETSRKEYMKTLKFFLYGKLNVNNNDIMCIFILPFGRIYMIKDFRYLNDKLSIKKSTHNVFSIIKLCPNFDSQVMINYAFK